MPHSLLEERERDGQPLECLKRLLEAEEEEEEEEEKGKLKSSKGIVTI